MSKIKKNFPLQNLDVVDISTEGKAIAKHEGLVVFIEGAVPGDKVDVMVHRKKSSFAEARVERIIELSPHRLTPVCQHFGNCGGCKWQNLKYSQQLLFKQKYVADAFTRIGKFQFPQPLPILGNAEEYFYRNKLEFSFSNKRWLNNQEMSSMDSVEDHNGLGFHIPGLFDKVLDIEKCHLQADPSNQIRNAVKAYAKKTS